MVSYKDVGGIELRDDLGKFMSLTEFSVKYGGRIEGITAIEAYKQVGGKVKEPKAVKDEVREIDKDD